MQWQDVFSQCHPHCTIGGKLDQNFKNGNVDTISTHEGLEKIKNDSLDNQIYIIESSKILDIYIYYKFVDELYEVGSGNRI